MDKNFPALSAKYQRVSKNTRPTVNKLFLEIRKIIAKYCEENSIFETGEIELDESYFGARRVRGNAIEFFPHPVENGRGAHGKIPVPAQCGNVW